MNRLNEQSISYSIELNNGTHRRFEVTQKSRLNSSLSDAMTQRAKVARTVITRASSPSISPNARAGRLCCLSYLSADYD
jgi:hypothetical protein